MFTAGQVLILEQGEYSAFAYAGPFRVLRDFTKEQAITAFNVATPTERDRDERYFVAWLAREKYIEDTAVEHWYLGDYDFRPFDFVYQDDALTGDDRFHKRSYQLTPQAEAAREARETRERIENRARYAANPELIGMTTGLHHAAIGIDDIAKG